jgi:tRNA (mo5U34)-methyltransferase
MTYAASAVTAIEPERPESLLSWFDNLQATMAEPGSGLEPWAAVLREQLMDILVTHEHGDQRRWAQALKHLPEVEGVRCDLNSDHLHIHTPSELDNLTVSQIHAGLEGLIPWRKGPFHVFDTFIDTEWRSDWKWQRVVPHLSSMEGRRVLDVGCGSGYHIWRMLGEGARQVVGVDPSRLFLMQFQAIKFYVEQVLGPVPAHLLPLKMEDVPPRLKAFDTVFSMGVLYHRKSPIEHLEELKGALRPGGELVLETLVIEGPLGQVLMPEDRYAMMRNVWYIPSPETLLLWCRRVGFRNPRVVDLNQTSLDEQRTTEWMKFNSLNDFLDPNDPTRTTEGYPAPLRAVVIADT